MHVASLGLRGFMSHANTVFTFPERGLVVITGHNGAGKSSLVEGVSVAAYGKTLRGSDPWSGSEGGVDLVLRSGLEVTRNVKKGAKALTWHRAGEPPTAYETNTKAQDALETVLGSFDVWRRASVFSSQDAAHFSLATDAERKRLLESILGLERFDAASDKARAAAALAAATVTRLERESAVAEQRVESARDALHNAEVDASMRAVREDDTPDATPEEHEARAKKRTEEADAVEAEARKLQKLITSAGTSVREAQDDLQNARAAETKRAKADAASQVRISNAEQRLAALQQAETCPTCDQPMHEEKRARLIAEATQALAEAKAKDAELESAPAADVTALEAALEEVREDRDALRARLAPLEEKAKRLRSEASAATAAIAVAKREAARIEAAEKRVEEARANLATMEERVKEAKDALAKADVEQRTFDACVRVLGTKGVRAHILGSALGGITAVANRWLSQMGTQLTVSLTATTEKKTGGTTDAIALNFTGAAGVHGYKGSSGGERRRADVALLLALGEVSAAAHGATPGTLFVDEAFDSLDADGVTHVGKVLRDLAAQRCVVVITHSTDLVSTLRPDLHYVVDHGTVTRA